MACCADRSTEDASQIKRAKRIDQEIKSFKKKTNQKVKLLLLGAGDSGKSTFAKQMKVVHHDGFSVTEVSKFQNILQENCLTSMQTLLNSDHVKVPKKIKIEKVLEAEDLKECAQIIKQLWAEPSVKEAYENRIEWGIQIPSHSAYYFDNVERFGDENFLPTSNDIIRAKMKTTGISEVSFQVEGIDFTFIDVGGQRSERRKWLHCFDDVTSVVYIAALDEYDMKLEEDNITNRFEESLKLFKDISSSTIFKPLSWILFLNKIDSFELKIKTKPLNRYFKEISEEDGKNVDFCVKFLQARYEANFRGSRLYAFVTCAIDTANCRNVFYAVRDTVIFTVLKDAGFV